ncbi:FtsX-like permease family protein [uncultured Paludibaculum sp.]|uniref:FtsX-like permease family protein n=1 Tax=uncultured Paludibaculum sp. TaxID=1765020 RepID=UPI00374CD1DF
MRQLLARLLARQYFAVWLFGTLSAIGLGLASLGVYGVLSNQIAERRREIGIRLAIGAGPVDLCRDLVGGISRPVVAGLAGGVVLAVVFSRLLRSVLPGVDSVDLWACLQATSVSVLAIFAGTAIPLRRALITDPTDSLRDGK